MSENRYNQRAEYVPAIIDAKPIAVTPPPLSALVDNTMPTNGSEDALALRSLETATEVSTPTQRAVATNLRAAGLLVAVGLVAFALRVAGAPAAFSAIGFAALLVAGYVWIVRLDHNHSPAGIERRKVDTYGAIRQAEIGAQERIALAKLKAYMQIVEKTYGRHHENAERES